MTAEIAKRYPVLSAPAGRESGQADYRAIPLPLHGSRYSQLNCSAPELPEQSSNRDLKDL